MSDPPPPRNYEIWRRVMSEGTTCIRSSTATANPTPACPFPYGVTVSPINRPPLSSRAPPAAVSGTFASVWMAPRTVVAFLVGTLRRNPLTTPALIVASCLNDADDADDDDDADDADDA